MNIKEAMKEADNVLNGIYPNVPSDSAVASLASGILVTQAIEKLADAIISNKESKIMPLVDPKDRRME